jgi:hypothetical protein
MQKIEAKTLAFVRMMRLVPKELMVMLGKADSKVSKFLNDFSLNQAKMQRTS